MNRHEPALRALRSLAQFEIVRAAREVLEAADARARASSLVESLEQRGAAFLVELRQILGRPCLNAPLLDTMRSCHRSEQSELREWRIRSRSARQHEQQLRESLARLRNQERSLERALQAERHKRELRIQASDMIRADELWLQHSLREIIA